MAEITLTLTQSPSGVSPTDASQSAQTRTPQQDQQMLEALGVLLNALAPNNAAGNSAPSSDNSPLNRSADALGDDAGQQDLSALLLKLLEKLISSDGAQNGQDPLSGSKDASTTGGASPSSSLDGAGTAGGAQSPENLSRSLLQDTTGNALNNAITPTEDGGGQISDNPLLKALLELIANLMDAQNGEFGQPQDPASGSPSGSSSPVSGGSAGDALSTPSSSTSSAPAETGKGAAPAGTGSAGSAGAVAFPTASGDVTTVDETIKVGPGEVFDGGGKTFVASDKLGDGGQKEGQKPIFELAEGATLKNVVFGDNAADGVHVRGDAKIDNVHWTNVGEDALTVKANNGKPANVEITNSSAQGASDKIFQLNADANLTIDNFKAKDFGTFVRTNGGQQGNWNLNLNNIDAENGKFSFVKSDSENLNVTGANNNLTNVKNHYAVPESANVQVN